MAVICFLCDIFCLVEFTNFSNKLAASNFRIEEDSFRQKQDGPP